MKNDLDKRERENIEKEGIDRVSLVIFSIDILSGCYHIQIFCMRNKGEH